MLKKELIKKKFEKSLNYYNDNAFIQKKTADDLISFLKKEKYSSILEIGSYTGILTEKVVKNIEFDKYLAIDIIDVCGFMKKINSKIEFQKKDIEKFETKEKFDLIISNASLQWCNDFFGTLKKLKGFLKENSNLAIVVFSKGNLFEIKETFNVGLDYPSINEIRKIFPDAEIFDKEFTLKFDNSLDILKHLKYTGVNSLSEKKYKITEIKNELEKLDKIYHNQITYKPLYIII